MSTTYTGMECSCECVQYMSWVWSRDYHVITYPIQALLRMPIFKNWFKSVKSFMRRVRVITARPTGTQSFCCKLVTTKKEWVELRLIYCYVLFTFLCNDFCTIVNGAYCCWVLSMMLSMSSCFCSDLKRTPSGTCKLNTIFKHEWAQYKTTSELLCSVKKVLLTTSDLRSISLECSWLMWTGKASWNCLKNGISAVMIRANNVT